MALHEYVRAYKVWQTATMLCFFIAMFKLINWMTEEPYENLTDFQVAPFTAGLAGFIYGIIQVLLLLIKSNEPDTQ